MSSPEIRKHRERQERASRGKRPDADLPVRLPAGAVHRPERPAEGAASCPPSSGKPSILRRIPWSGILFWVSFLCLLGLQIFMIRTHLQNQQAREEEVLEIQEQQEQLERQIREATPTTCEVRYLVPNQEDIVQQVRYGDTVPLHEPVLLDGYTFLYWETTDGTAEMRSDFIVYEDKVLIARYALPLETERHITYLSTDRYGVVDVDAIVTIREYVEILYRLLNIDLVGSGSFQDVSKKDSCFKAAATLKDLGILEGNYLYPDEPLRYGELLEVLERFYPPTDVSFDFPELDSNPTAYRVYCTAAAYGWIDAGDTTDPTSPVTRGQLAHVVNRVLGRNTAARTEEARVGMILDVGPNNPYYADIAEAVIPHSYTWKDSVEVWIASTPLPVHEPGLFFAGVRLHCISDNGRPIRGTTIGGRTFNANGELTSGDPELDRELWEILEDNVDPENMEPEEMLRILYDYVCDNYSPCSDTLYEIGAEGWAVKEAKRILAHGEASSYGYAALFYELSYMIGYQPVLISGVIYGQQTDFETEDGVRIEANPGYMPHAWVEIKFDGISFIFDPAGESQIDPNRLYYMRNEPIRWQRGYRNIVF